MKTINVAPDVYDYLLEQVATADRSISDLLRERLRITATARLNARPAEEAKSELDELLASTEFRYTKGVVAAILGAPRLVVSETSDRLRQGRNDQGPRPSLLCQIRARIA
jgi:negative regulator of replication initiation